MERNLYGLSVLPKAGLANMLIPWAECFIWCKENGVKQIDPQWTKFRIGPYLRGERDKRQYQRLFSKSGNITGLKRLYLRLTSQIISYDQFRLFKDLIPNFRSTIVRFSDMNHLDRLIPYHKEIMEELLRITKSKYLPHSLPEKYIALHIRMGDFPEKLPNKHQIYFKVPLHWYIEALNELRKSLGFNLPAIVFSDGSDQELNPILKLVNVQRSPFVESITDLLAISKSNILITSRSSFSLFGAFLGQVPSIWYEGKNDICGIGYMQDNHPTQLDVEWMPGNSLPIEYITELKDRINS